MSSLTLLAAAALTGQWIAGPAHIIDADTLDIAGTRLRLAGVDAVELHQRCITRDGAPWPCGERARAALATLIADQAVSCRTQGADVYRRQLARCYLGRRDLNRWLVAHGWAVAYGRDAALFVGAEAQARRARRGVWAGQFQAPCAQRRTC